MWNWDADAKVREDGRLSNTMLTSRNLRELLFEALLSALCSETVASQYFLELAKYVGLPVISWNADNSALEKVKEKVRDVLNCVRIVGWQILSI